MILFKNHAGVCGWSLWGCARWTVAALICLAWQGLVLAQSQPAALAAESLVTITAGRDWKVVDQSNPWPLKGSALDLSRFVDPAPAGSYGRVIRTPDGHLAFASRPQQRVRFFGCTIVMELAFSKSALTTKAKIEAYAEHIRQQGYNVVRPHFLNHMLMEGATHELEFNAEACDRFEYFVKCLKDRGIYLYLDAVTSGKGYTEAPAWTEAANAIDLSNRLYYDPEARRHWEAGVRQLLTHLNPYTNTRLVDDPILAVLLCFNEQEMNPWYRIPPRFAQPWREFLKKKYGTMAALRAAWVGEADKQLTQANSFDELPLFTTLSLWEPNQRGLDAESFIIESEKEMADWYLQCLHAIGYHGLVSQFDFAKALRNAVPRQRLDVISMHGYHAHPEGYTDPGSKIAQTSSLADGVNYFRGMAVTRFGDRPFMLTEYGHVYWNRYRYEEGLVMGAYSGLQDYDGLMAFASPVLVVPETIKPFNVGPDPVGRASQTVAAFLFARRDISPARHYVNLEIRPEELFNYTNIHEGASSEQSHVALVTGFGLSYAGQGVPAEIRPRRSDVTLRCGGGAPIFANATFAALVDKPEVKPQQNSFFDELKARGILPATNRTDVARGLYESEDGQILLDTRQRLISVCTPRLEGVCFETLPAPVKLNVLTVLSSSVAANVTAIALDDAPLAESRRILLVYATDALNSEAQFAGPDRTELRFLGKRPVLLRTGQVELTLRNNNAGLKCWALGLDGGRKQPLAASTTNGLVRLTVDTATLASGATPFFELATE